MRVFKDRPFNICPAVGEGRKGLLGGRCACRKTVSVLIVKGDRDIVVERVVAEVFFFLSGGFAFLAAPGVDVTISMSKRLQSSYGIPVLKSSLLPESLFFGFLLLLVWARRDIDDTALRDPFRLRQNLLRLQIHLNMLPPWCH
jgi:hypothetical protein